mmetsp:Transcript_131555/g.281250  ORF Transcript_131555/g.281250 Transcript_131555/m.281250 type:complete len:387 (+) Transcript_131555:42-1202(+)
MHNSRGRLDVAQASKEQPNVWSSLRLPSAISSESVVYSSFCCISTICTSLNLVWPMASITVLLTSLMVALSGTVTSTAVPLSRCVKRKVTKPLSASSASSPWMSSKSVCSSNKRKLSGNTVLGLLPRASMMSSTLVRPVGSPDAISSLSARRVLPNFTVISWAMPKDRSSQIWTLMSLSSKTGVGSAGAVAATAALDGAAFAFFGAALVAFSPEAVAVKALDLLFGSAIDGPSKNLPMQKNSVRPLSLSKSGRLTMAPPAFFTMRMSFAIAPLTEAATNPLSSPMVMMSSTETDTCCSDVPCVTLTSTVWGGPKGMPSSFKPLPFRSSAGIESTVSQSFISRPSPRKMRTELGGPRSTCSQMRLLRSLMVLVFLIVMSRSQPSSSL